MDPAAGVYATVINGMSTYFAKADARQAVESLRMNLPILDGAGVKYELNGGLLTVTSAETQSRAAFYEFILAHGRTFEGRYGVTELWKPLKLVIVKAIFPLRDLVREYGMEIPIARYGLEYTSRATLFGFDLEGRMAKNEWTKAEVLVTNHRMLLPPAEDIRLHRLATIGREIYMGDEESVNKYVRVVDCMSADRLSSYSLLFRGPKDTIVDFLNTLRIARTESRRIGLNETRVLLGLYYHTSLRDLPEKCNLQSGQLSEALRRLHRQKYIEEIGSLTSDGIKMVDELINVSMI
ncbi:MAG: hypothetical protein V1875_07425 [Candidatus Altiarchaeota archaeon]